MPKLSTPPKPLVRYCFASLLYGLLFKPGYSTNSTSSCFSNHSASSNALSTVRCTRSDNVSNPCNNKNELNGLCDGPKSLKPSTLARIINAMFGKPRELPSPKTSQNFNP